MFPRLQAPNRSSRRAQPYALAVVAVVCLALLAFLTVAQVAHSHADSTDADHCPLCIVMHSAAPVVAAAALILLVQVALAAPTPVLFPAMRRWRAQLFIRPPPHGC